MSRSEQSERVNQLMPRMKHRVAWLDSLPAFPPVDAGAFPPVEAGALDAGLGGMFAMMGVVGLGVVRREERVLSRKRRERKGRKERGRRGKREREEKGKGKEREREGRVLFLSRDLNTLERGYPKQYRKAKLDILAG